MHKIGYIFGFTFHREGAAMLVCMSRMSQFVSVYRPRSSSRPRSYSHFVSRVALGLSLLALATATKPLAAKEVGLDGVMVYVGANGPAYVQFRDLLFNGKLEFRSCAAPTLDKNSYKNLPKFAIAGLTSLERLPDGTLQAEFASGPAQCVVPANFKFDKEPAMPMADLIDKMSFVAQVVGSEPAGTTAFPAIPRGAKIFIVAPTDQELARYLVATRTATIAQWHVYLGLYGIGPHTDAAKKSLETLLLADGQTELKSYQTSKERPGRYAHLKNAQIRVNELVTLQDPDPDALALHTAVTAELRTLTDLGQADLVAYRKALAGHTAGYAQLLAAREPSDAVIDVDPKLPAGVALHTDLLKELNTVETDLKAAQANLTAQHFDEAWHSIERYAAFVDEEPRFKAVRETVYKHHMDAAAQFETAGKFSDAVAEYQKADAITSTDASKAALVAARASLLTTENQAAADKALAKSKDYFDDNDFIHAYEVLLNLNEQQHKLVADQMKVIEPQYITAATDWARKAQTGHSPIQGRADEDALRQAYTYLDRVNKLADDPDVKVRLDLLSDTISTYYVGLAQKYFAKPVGSGVGMGWSYLDEAATYQPGLPAIRDERTKASATYQVRSKLSVLVIFRDQTSRRDSVGFAEQLQDSIATGLENAKLPVRVIRPVAGTPAGGVEANYQLVGEILQHRSIQTVTPETLQSKYRSGEHDIPNPAWNQADQEYQDAQAALIKAQSDQKVAIAKNNKKQISDATAEIDAAQKLIAAARAKTNSVPKSLQEDVIRPYTYTKRHIDITNIVELSFRIIDSAGATIEDSITVKREVPKKFTVLENIKPDDTEGVHDIDAAPDENQLMTDVEISARDELVKLAHDKVVDLPARVLAQARAKVKSQDADAAAEAYVLYLNSTTSTETPERLEAIHFLNDNYNIRHAAALSASVP